MNKKLNKNNVLCHPELVSGSICGSAWRVGNTLNGSGQRDNGFRTKSGMTDQSGRSMVEMLGVLAIIGVLSVGGISGYTTAMNKHKANEILNAAAIRAMEVSAQIQSGVDPSIATAGVTTEDVGSVQIGSASPVGTEQFKLVFTSNIDGPICDQMKNIAGENSVVGVACDRLLYNNDMSTGVENKNVDSVDNEGNYTCKTAGFDPDSKCESCKTGYTGLSCNTCAEGYESDGEGGCQEVQTCKGAESVGDDCEDNEGLCPGYYCHVGVNYNYDESTDEETCSTRAGEIRSVGAPEPVTWVSGAYCSPTHDLTYDAAWNYCEALKNADDSVKDSKGNSVKSKITQGLYQTTSEYIKKDSDDYYYWVNRDTGSPSNMGTSCDAFLVYDDGIVSGSYRGNGRAGSDGRYYALCK